MDIMIRQPPQRRLLNLVFEAPTLDKQVTIEKGFLYYLLANKYPSVIGPVDLKKNLWYSQIICGDDFKTLEEINTDELLNDIAGMPFEKKIIDVHFWYMQNQIANKYSDDTHHIFLAGDSAHAISPTGGFGLNTGFGDAVNLGWKLAAVIQNKAHPTLLKTYEEERRPVCLKNLEVAEKNAEAMSETKKKFAPEKDFDAFAKASAKVAQGHALAAGITMCYAYYKSPLTILQKDQSTTPIEPADYNPQALPGYFLPFVEIEGQSIYQKLSPTAWTLIVCDDFCDLKMDGLNILNLPKNTYPYRYMLLRPDWHISYVSNELDEKFVREFLAKF